MGKKNKELKAKKNKHANLVKELVGYYPFIFCDGFGNDSTPIDNIIYSTPTEALRAIKQEQDCYATIEELLEAGEELWCAGAMIVPVYRYVERKND